MILNYQIPEVPAELVKSTVRGMLKGMGGVLVAHGVDSATSDGWVNLTAQIAAGLIIFGVGQGWSLIATYAKTKLIRAVIRENLDASASTSQFGNHLGS